MAETSNIIAPTPADLGTFLPKASLKDFRWHGHVDDPEKFAAEERKKIFDALGDLDPVRLLWNRILVAIWKAPEAKDLGGGRKLYRTVTSTEEDIWQHTSGLLVKAGPTAFLDEEWKTIEGAPRVGDWVLFQRGYGTRYKLNGVHCIVIDKEIEAIKAVLLRPDAVDVM